MDKDGNLVFQTAPKVPVDDKHGHAEAVPFKLPAPYLATSLTLYEKVKQAFEGVSDFHRWVYWLGLQQGLKLWGEEQLLPPDLQHRAIKHTREEQITRLLDILRDRDNHNREGQTELAALDQTAVDETVKRLDPVTARAFQAQIVTLGLNKWTPEVVERSTVIERRFKPKQREREL